MPQIFNLDRTRVGVNRFISNCARIRHAESNTTSSEIFKTNLECCFGQYSSILATFGYINKLWPRWLIFLFFFVKRTNIREYTVLVLFLFFSLVLVDLSYHQVFITKAVLFFVFLNFTFLRNVRLISSMENLTTCRSTGSYRLQSNKWCCIGPLCAKLS